MSHDAHPRWLLSEEEVFNWFSVEPRTYNWQVLVALDRKKTNDLLMQEYIQRYARDTYMDPITNKVQTADGATQVWEYLYDHVLGPPRLSFENSDTNEWARMTMPIVGGIQMTVEQSGGGTKQVTQISWYDPLQAPRLIAEISLEDTSGEVTESDEVQLDLTLGTNFRLTFASTYQQQKEGGQFYKALFDALDDERKRFLLGKLAPLDDDAVLKPDKFRLRALSAQPARSPMEEGSSEGAILMFVGTEGHPSGSLPDAQAKWIYPIPAGHSSTMLVGNEVIYKELLEKGIADSEVVLPCYEYINDGKALSGLKFTNGAVHLLQRKVRVDGINRDLNIFGSLVLFEEGADTIFTVQKQGEQIHMDWIVPTQEYNNHWARLVTDEDPDSSVGAGAWVQCGVESKYVFFMNEEQHVELALVEDEIVWAKLTPYAVNEMFEPHLEKCIETVKIFIESQLLDFQRTISSGIKQIETFATYGLLFTSGNVVEQKSVRLPCDLAIFGDISPGRASFRLDPIEKEIIHGGSFQFSASPPQTGLTWKLERVPGFEGALGSISQSGGYTAPKADEIPASQAYTMVRVTASNEEVTSSALVRVLRRSIVINPMVVAAGKVARKVRFSAGSLVEGPLTWSVESVTGGTLTDNPPEEDAAEFDPTDMFYVPGTGSSGEPYSIDVITVRDAQGNIATAHLVLLEEQISGTVVILSDSELPEGQLQLGLDVGGDPMTSDAEWRVLAGAGSVDENGLFTMDPTSEHPFAVVGADFRVGDFVHIPGYSILPLGLVNVDEIQRALR